MVSSLTRNISEHVGKMEIEKEKKEGESSSSKNGKARSEEASVKEASSSADTTTDTPQEAQTEVEKEVERVELVRGAGQNIFESVHAVVTKIFKEDLAFACLSNLIAADLQVTIQVFSYLYFRPFLRFPS